MVAKEIKHYADYYFCLHNSIILTHKEYLEMQMHDLASRQILILNLQTTFSYNIDGAHQVYEQRCD